MNRKLISETEAGQYTITLTSNEVVWNNGKRFTEYSVARLHKTKFTGAFDYIRTYKRLETAQKQYERLANFL